MLLSRGNIIHIFLPLWMWVSLEFALYMHSHVFFTTKGQKATELSLFALHVFHLHRFPTLCEKYS